MVRATLSRISRFFSRRRPVKEIEHDITTMIIDRVINNNTNSADLERMKALVKELPADTKYVMPPSQFHGLDGPREKKRARRLIRSIYQKGGRSKKRASCGCNSRRTRHRRTLKH